MMMKVALKLNLAWMLHDVSVKEQTHYLLIIHHKDYIANFNKMTNRPRGILVSKKCFTKLENIKTFWAL